MEICRNSVQILACCMSYMQTNVFVFKIISYKKTRYSHVRKIHVKHTKSSGVGAEVGVRVKSAKEEAVQCYSLMREEEAKVRAAPKYCQQIVNMIATFASSFSAVSAPIFAIQYAFCSIF